jgi:hypothetical protein
MMADIVAHDYPDLVAAGPACGRIITPQGTFPEPYTVSCSHIVELYGLLLITLV